MNKVFIVIGIIVLAAIGGFIIFQNSVGPQNNSDSNTNTPGQEQHTITFTGSAYSPSEITVNKGDTVVFKNESSSQFWPASNIHPTHTVYPEFDPKRALSPGQNYSFTFERSGTWGYHDHLNPSHTGVIVVE